MFTKNMISDPPVKKWGNILSDPFPLHIVVINYNQIITMAVLMAVVFMYIHICEYACLYAFQDALERLIQMRVINVSE